MNKTLAILFLGAFTCVAASEAQADYYYEDYRSPGPVGAAVEDVGAAGANLVNGVASLF